MKIISNYTSELLFKCSFLMAVMLLLVGCSSIIEQVAPNPDFNRTNLSLRPSKKLLVFFDGTANEWNSRTNVRRLFELVAAQEDPKIVSLYIEGVGTSYHPLTGGIFGYGMKPRILDGYKFLASHYQKGDQIYIFGFSRGAHQARTLAGLLAYNGLPISAKEDLKTVAEKIWDFCREKDDANDEEWKKWNPEQGAIWGSDIKNKLGVDTVVAEVSFLGVWDTVPGSQFKKYNLYGESPDRVEGVRYKIQPYPTIKRIAHAVSLDEKRSKFRPVFFRKPIDSRTMLEQIGFPGAHSDIGGGYEDTNDLAGISLNWMLDLLKTENLFNDTEPKVYADTAGLAHWSIDHKPGNTGSKYEDRVIPAADVFFHSSVTERMNRASVPVKHKEIAFEKYAPTA